MDASTSAVGGPSSLPERPTTVPSEEKKTDDRKRRRPKRKHAPGSDATATEVGDANDIAPEVYHTPWIDAMGTGLYESREQRLHDEIVAFFAHVSPTPYERHARAVVIAQVAEVVKRRLPKAAVDTFGSVAQDLYLPDGDTDLVITAPHPYDDDTKRRVLFQLAALMRNTGLTHHTHVVAHARVPLISFQTPPDLGSLKIDISMNAPDGLRAVPILRDYFVRVPALRFLVMTLKSLLSRHGLNSASSSGLSSYGLICLTIAFLQLNPAGRPADFIDQPLESKSFGVLLTDFLEFYADKFPYESSYISVTHGKIMSKEEKGWVNAKNPESLCIECLLNPDNDVGRPTSKIRKIRAVFREAYTLIQTYPFEPSSTAHNILGTIIGVSESTLAHRALINDIVTSGRLMNALKDVQNSGPPQGSHSGRRPPPSSAQQPYPPRHYPRPNAYPQTETGPLQGDRAQGRPPPSLPRPPPEVLPPKPRVHGLPARPPPPVGGYDVQRHDGGRPPGGRLIDRLSEPQAPKRRRN